MIPFLKSLNLSMTLKGLFSSFLLTSNTVTRSSEQQESIVSPLDKIGLKFYIFKFPIFKMETEWFLDNPMQAKDKPIVLNENNKAAIVDLKFKVLTSCNSKCFLRFHYSPQIMI